MKTFARLSVLGVFASGIMVLDSCSAVSDSTPAATSRRPVPDTPGVQRRYADPEQAVAALKTAARADDRAALREIFGPEGRDLASGDAVADANDRAVFANAITHFCRVSREGDDKVVLNLGAQDWPFPIPLVKKDGQWYFDTAAGRDEIINRRVGENELMAIDVCRVYVAAQREYATTNHDGSGVLKYAQRLRSTEGQKDGLYWEIPPGGEPSPFGPLVANARAEGYGSRREGEAPRPFHGYLFKILTAQGPNALGGRKSYIADGAMTAGFALVAHPVQWGDSGVMTFIVGQDGVTYQRNLGPDTAATVAQMIEFDPGPGWTPVGASVGDK